MVQFSAFESLLISIARFYSYCKVSLECIELSDSIELSSSKMLLLCHNAINYAALIFVYMEIMHVNIYNFHIIFIESKNKFFEEFLQWYKDIFSGEAKLDGIMSF